MRHITATICLTVAVLLGSASLVMLSAKNGIAEEMVVNKKGEPVLLKDDGTWELVSTKGEDGKVVSFNDLMSLMENKEITLRLPHGDRPMKVTKENGKWQMEQTRAHKVSEIVSDGKNRIKMEDYPYNWVINGTWEFRKYDNKCQINHTRKHLIMFWKC